jgi:hypothetical protein
MNGGTHANDRAAQKGQLFYKYMPASTARLVLENRTLRWSSPLLFNDPFDVPRKFASGVSAREIAEAASRSLAQLVEAPPADLSYLRPELQELGKAAKRAPEALRQAVNTAVSKFLKDFRPSSEGLSELRRIWGSWLADFRILCFAEQLDNTAMWYHYADSYRGVVLGFVAREDLDSAWLEARPVQYPKEKPPVYTAEGIAEILMMPQAEACRALLRIATFTKAPDWAYEREWRVSSHKRPGDTGLFTDYGFNARELVAVYFGPLTPPASKQDIMPLVAQYPEASVFEVSIGFSRELVFRRVAIPDATTPGELGRIPNRS